MYESFNEIERIRAYSLQDVYKLRGPSPEIYTRSLNGANKLRLLLNKQKCIKSLGCLNGNQAIQCVKAGLHSIYVSGWQIAASQNLDGEMYPDLSLYSRDSIPFLVRNINKCLYRQSQIDSLNDRHDIDWMVPLVVDCEAGGGILQTYELVKHCIETGSAAIHLENLDPQDKKCGHMGGKTLISTPQFIKKLKAARLAADVCNVPLVIIARTDAESAKYLGGTNNPSLVDQAYITGKYDESYTINGCIDYAIDTAIAFCPYSDMIWYESSSPDLDEAKHFAKAIHKLYPYKWLCYNLSPSFNWIKMPRNKVLSFQDKLTDYGYKYQFVTLAGFHSMNYSMYNLAKDYRNSMEAYQKLQQSEEQLQSNGYNALKHQQFVGTEYFDKIQEIISGSNDKSSLMESTEQKQF